MKLRLNILVKGNLIKRGEDYIFIPFKSKPKDGIYILENAETGTKAQNSLFHSLIQCLYNWMLKTDHYQFEVNDKIYDFSCPDWLNLKDIFKYRYGKGFSHYEFVNDMNGMSNTTDFSTIPDYVIKDFNNGNRDRIKGILISWAKYGVRDRKNLLDNTLNIMRSIGVDSKKFTEIQEGIE